MTTKQNITATAGTEGKPESTLDETCPHCGIDWRQHSWSTFDECKPAPPSDQPHKRQESAQGELQNELELAQMQSEINWKAYKEASHLLILAEAQRDALLAACKAILEMNHGLDGTPEVEAAQAAIASVECVKSANADHALEGKQ